MASCGRAAQRSWRALIERRLQYRLRALAHDDLKPQLTAQLADYRGVISDRQTDIWLFERTAVLLGLYNVLPVLPIPFDSNNHLHQLRF